MNPQTATDVAIRARARYVSDYARAFLSADGSMDVRKYTANLDTADRALDADLADAKVRAAKESIRAIQTRIDVGRSYASAIKAEIALAGVS